ncbi:MAG: WbqC family protein [Bacteroidaceae bacterium]|nr:WbqC family protein [Bacteroidaceae bacterium]MBQ2595728.1 WbqC family protein [Bacteroidaceae bacterium]MBQ3957985.1 WbqC family protein [Bacteroidaceae bacterium]
MNSCETLVLPTAYLPPISYFRAAMRHDCVQLEACEHYVKQTLRNRCWIDSPAGRLPLTIPVEKTVGKVAIRDVRISDHGNWRHQHWNALVSSYHQTPFFEYYADDFAPFYERKYTFLLDFNEQLLQLVAKEIDVSLSTVRTSHYVGCTAWDGQGEVKPYYQIFASQHGFLPDLSIVDLLFNMGNESVLFL